MTKDANFLSQLNFVSVLIQPKSRWSLLEGVMVVNEEPIMM